MKIASLFLFALLVFIAGCEREAPVAEDVAPDTTQTDPVDPFHTDVPEEEELDSVWRDALERGALYRGLGQEPGWTVEIHDGRIELVADYGENAYTFTDPVSAPEGAAAVYVAATDEHDLTVTIRREACTDIMSGEAFPTSVEVILDDRTLRGCGRWLQ
jgi:uncharacterized membrane protein